MTETKLTSKLVKELRLQGCMVLNTHGHAMQAPGWPDFYLAAPDGLQVWIEAKGLTTQLTAIQKHILSQLKQKGVNAFVLRFVSPQIYSLEDENGKLLLAFTFKNKTQAAIEFLHALRQIAKRDSNGIGASETVQRTAD